MNISFRVAIKTKTSVDWEQNGLRFFDAVDARTYGRALQRRWPELIAFEVQPCTDLPNCHYPVPNDRYPVKRKEE